jgi:K+-transporting ATPase ATPase A chain
MLGMNTPFWPVAMIGADARAAGFLAEKKVAPESVGTFPVTTPLFVVLLVSVVLIVSALTFFPALSLGPIVEHLLMGSGKLF